MIEKQQGKLPPPLLPTSRSHECKPCPESNILGVITAWKSAQSCRNLCLIHAPQVHGGRESRSLSLSKAGVCSTKNEMGFPLLHEEKDPMHAGFGGDSEL
jgi:hypothetical protein